MYLSETIHKSKTKFFQHLKFCNKFKGNNLEYLLNKLSENNKDFNYDLDNINIKDKGLLGKFTKNIICSLGQKQILKFDDEIIRIRTINLNEKKDNIIYVKERLTLDNIGTNKDNSLENFTNKKFFSETNIFNKIRKNIIFKFKFKKVVTKKDFLNIQFLGIFYIDILDFPEIFMNQINNDYCNIKKEINEKTFSSKNQKYLHIHKHGNKNSETKAIGFKNIFMTELIKLYLLMENNDWKKLLINNYNIKIKNNNLCLEKY